VRRRDFITLAAGVVSAWPSNARTQEAKIYKVGVILQGGSWYAMVEGLRQGLSEQGLVEGKQVVFDIRDMHGDLKAVEKAAKNLEDEKVDLICTFATSVSVAAKRATRNVPIVFAAGTNPVAVRLVESIPRPGGRLTGVEFRATDLTGKRLELLREIVPDLRRVATFYDPNNPSAIEAVHEAREATRKLHLELVERHVSSVDELKKVLQAFKRDEADAVVAVSDAMVDSQIQYLIEMAITRKLPTMLYDPGAVIRGGLATYSPDYSEVGRISANYVGRILAGAKPGDLPVEGADKLLLVINLKTAKEIGLAIPESILVRADKVIE
jgi:ABC-type uncharacterized transport system substrate-binding protein